MQQIDFDSYQTHLFDVNLAIKYAEMLINHDEVERALLVLDNLPAYYRDNPPKEVLQLRKEILAALITPHGYMTSNLDNVIDFNSNLLNGLLRGILIKQEVENFNKQGVIPHIVDVGPGEYFIPIGLDKEGLKFTYWDVAMDSKTQSIAHPYLNERNIRIDKRNHKPSIFLALEVIEHLPEPRDLAAECLKYCGDFPDAIHISTPKYCFDVSEKNWKKPYGLPHLRAYTPNELLNELKAIFPHYEWVLYDAQLLSVRGIKKKGNW